MGLIEKVFDKEDSLLDVFRHFVFKGSLTTNYTLGRFEDELKSLLADRKRLEWLIDNMDVVDWHNITKRIWSGDIKENIASIDIVMKEDSND